MRLGERGTRKIAGGAEVAAAAHQHDADRELARLPDDGEDIDVALALGGDELLRLDALQRGELVADLRGALELEPPGGLLHARLQLRRHLLAAALEHLDRRGHVLRVGLARDQADAGRRAAPDLVLQARAAAVGEEAVAAVADAEQLLQLVERVAHRAGIGERTEVALPGAARPAVEGEAREAMLVAQLDVGKALVIAQDDVEARLVRLDEVVLEQQRLGLRVGDRDLDRA